MRRARAIRPGRLALALAVAVVLALALAQVLLPRIAAARIKTRVGRFGQVQSVSVSAWPAIELLWGSAGSATVRARSLRLTSKQAAALLWEARGIDRVDVQAERAELGSLSVSRARLEKRGSGVDASALASESQVRAALPAGLSLRLLGSRGGKVAVLVSGGLFGAGGSLAGEALASDGRLVARTTGRLGAGVQLTLFAAPHVYVAGVAANRVPGGYSLAMRATLR